MFLTFSETTRTHSPQALPVAGWWGRPSGGPESNVLLHMGFCGYFTRGNYLDYFLMLLLTKKKNVWTLMQPNSYSAYDVTFVLLKFV